MLTETKGAKVAEVWDNSRGVGVWSPSFNRLFNDWEIGEVQIFLNMINSRRTRQMEKDRLLWKGDSNGRCTIWINVTQLEGVFDKKSPLEIVMEQFSASQSDLLCVGSLVGKNSCNGAPIRKVSSWLVDALYAAKLKKI